MGFCDFPLADKLCAVGDAVDFASDPGKAIGDWMAKSAGELAAAAADLAAEAVNTTTKVDLNATWFVDNYGCCCHWAWSCWSPHSAHSWYGPPSDATDKHSHKRSPAP